MGRGRPALPPSPSEGPGQGRRPSTGAAQGLEPGLGVPLLGRGTSGATFPASSRPGRLCPPEPARRGTTLAAPFLRWWEVREPPGNREGKVLHWGSSGSQRGGWGKRAENRDSFLGVRSEVVREVLGRGGVSQSPAFWELGSLPDYAENEPGSGRGPETRRSARRSGPSGRKTRVGGQFFSGHTLLWCRAAECDLKTEERVCVYGVGRVWKAKG